MTVKDRNGDGGGGESDQSVFSIYFDWDEDRKPSTTIVESVAMARGCSPTELQPLYDVIETEALDTILGMDGSKPGKSVRLSFRYAEVNVLVDSDAGIEIRQGDTDEATSVDSDDDAERDR